MKGAVEKIVVCTDLSPAGDAAASEGVAPAQRAAARLHLVPVVHGHVMMASELRRPVTVDERNAAEERALARLRGLAFTLGHHGVAIECIVVHGNPHEEIPRLPERLGAQLLVMTRPSCFLGSTLETVLRDADVPVLALQRPAAAHVAEAEGERDGHFHGFPS